MKLITRNTDYALRALCYIAEQEKDSVSVPEMVAALHIPRPFLRKLLQTLSAEGILQSFKGQGGGFTLARDPEQIRLTELIRIFQGTVELNECIFKRKVCPNRATCRLKREIDAIEKDVLRRLSAINIASLTAHRRIRPKEGVRAR
ncbi:MAG TPA: Rrf2 family transcriptional regulator [Candidatus Omnitrophota bacterium]|nr:Rrf2 family transcriptional regulator [Candidatus Omnitrophota bacterium]